MGKKNSSDSTAQSAPTSGESHKFWSRFLSGVVAASLFLLQLSVIFLLGFILFTSSARPHEDGGWIARAGKTSKTGGSCCGAGDCFIVRPVDYQSGMYFFSFRDRPFSVPEKDAQLSEDDHYWACFSSEFSIRDGCFFRPSIGA